MEDSSKEEQDTEQCDSLLVSDDLRQLILQQLASVEPSNVSDEDSYSVRLSCILEDDEGESSANQKRNKEFPKKETVARKMGERDKEREDAEMTEKNEESESSSDDLHGCFVSEDVPVTDLDEFSFKNSDRGCSPSEKTEIQSKTDEDGSTEKETDENTEEDDEEARNAVPFAIKKLKSSDNIFKKKFVPKKTEFSSDSSDIDISISNEKPNDAAAPEAAEVNTVAATDIGAIRDVQDSQKPQNGIFHKVSKAYLEKAKSREEAKDEGNYREGSVERELLNCHDEEDPKMILQIVQLRSRSPKVYTPPVPPETYLWEELKRIRGKGGYPWTYLDKPPFDEAAWKKYMEHEYEPINPPPLTSLRRQEKEPDKIEKISDIPETERHYKRMPHKVEEIKKMEEDEMNEDDTAAMAEEVRTAEDMEIERLAAAQELQKEVENRYLTHTPTTTTASRTDCDVNTSMLDSSGLEDIPLKRGSRNKVKSQAYGIPQKLRNQAGKIRSKIRNMPKPSLVMRERQKNGGTQEKSRFKLPERPKLTFPDKAKFTIPDRPKFKIPDRPKFNLLERSKFHLPEKPKFNLPDRPKFNFPERPKFNLPERPKLHLPERPKFNLPERPKLHLPERPKFNLPEVSKFHLPDRSKFHLPERAKINLPSFVRPLRERQGTSPRKNILELDFKSYPKIFSKKCGQRREFMTSSPKKTRGSTPPPKMTSEQPLAPERKKVPVGQRWLKKMDDIKYADEDMSLEVKESRKSDGSDSLFDFKDKDLGGFMEDLDESRFPPGGRKTLSTKSSTSHISDRDVESLGSSEGRLRKGVLEEIDSDEFFLRQKGISQEDIDMGKYLSHEIREAFRSPEVNALARMSYEYDEIEDENRPSRPSKTRSLKKSCLKKQFESDPALSENSGYKTYPPKRPNRKSRSQSKSLVNEEAAIAESSPTYENEPRAYPVEEYYKRPGPVKEYQHYKVPRPISEMTPIPHKRKKTWKKRFENVIGSEASVEGIDPRPQQSLTRKKSKSPDGKEETAEKAISEGEHEFQISKESESIVQKEEQRVLEEAPTPPRRTRSSSRESRSIRSSLPSVGLDESKDAVDVTDESHLERVEASLESQSFNQEEMPKPHHYEVTEDDPGFGYATIGKPTVKRPARKKEKLQRAPPPRRKREVASLFNTASRRTPIRPMRNYSTLGPSRPPRKSKIRSAKRLSHSMGHVHNDYNDAVCENIVKPLRYEECHESNKDLQKEEIIERMKGRPLPPPPRPPRQKSKGQEDFQGMEESEDAKISMALLKGEVVPVEVEALIHVPPPDVEAVEEVCASTQTDPLPDDFLLDMEVDVIQEFSHEQLKMQQSFMEKMKREENLGDGSREAQVEAETESLEDKQRINQILEMELLAELKRDAEQQKTQNKTDRLDPFDTDLGYASLERRQHKQEQPEPSTSQTVPQAIRVSMIPDVSTAVKVLRTDKLDVRELEVEMLNVKQVQAHGLQVSNLETGHVTADAVSTRSGNLLLENIELPPGFIQQVVERIPWDELRVATPAATTTIRRLESEDENLQNSSRSTPRRHRRHRQPAYSSDEEKRHEEVRPHRRHLARAQTPNAVELSRQLATVCAASGIRAMRGVALRIQNAQMQDKALFMRIVLCVVILLIAGFLLLGYDSKTVLHHHWEFQFPPQPPPHQFF